MTINQLIKKLQKIEATYGKRIKVSCDASGMKKQFNDVFDIITVQEVEVDTVRMCDGDGYGQTKANGEEVWRTTVILK